MMEQKVREDVLRRVRKLLALGMQDNAEGASAREKANALMKENNVRFLDLEGDDGTVEAQEIRIDWRRYRNDFEAYLAKHICNALDCSYLRSRHNTKWAQHIVIGLPTDLELAEWLFKYTRLQVYKLAEGRGYKGKELRTYLHGLLIPLAIKIEEVFGKREDDVHESVECRDMIVVKDALVKRKKNELYPDASKGRRGRPLYGSSSAYYDGQKDAEKVNLHRQVGNNGVQTEKIGG